ncbi:MAG: PorV/PorQ family protein [candidate division WOR-3 bacterium]
MPIRNKILQLFMALGIAIMLYAGPGDAGAAFLRIPVDARVVGMGEAGVSYIDNPSALYYNPAGIAYIHKFGILFMHNAWLLGMNHEYLAGTFNLKNIGTFGMAFNYWGSGEIQGVTIRGDTIPGYYFSASDWVISLGYARQFQNFSLGIGFKYLSEKNESLSTSAMAIDIGSIYKTPLKGLDLGLSFSNLGTSVKLDQESFALPLLVRLGWRYNIKDFNITQDFIFSNGDNFGFGAGVEYWVAQILSLRFGYRTGSDYDGLSGLRAGFGVLLKGFGIDYGVAPYGKLGISHRFSLYWKQL